MPKLPLGLIAALALASSIRCFGGLPGMANIQDLRIEPKIAEFVQHLAQEEKIGNSLVTSIA